MKNWLYTLIAVAIVAAFIADQRATEGLEWKGWVYPDRNYLVSDIPLGAFPSLESCRASAKRTLFYTNEYRRPDGSNRQGDYECGFQCKPDGGLGGLNVCEKTVR